VLAIHVSVDDEVDGALIVGEVVVGDGAGGVGTVIGVGVGAGLGAEGVVEIPALETVMAALRAFSV